LIRIRWTRRTATGSNIGDSTISSVRVYNSRETAPRKVLSFLPLLLMSIP
jgi:hypothetical protein